ncbi:hypothetical protein FKM82_004576 [Ascaphus truei]
MALISRHKPEHPLFWEVLHTNNMPSQARPRQWLLSLQSACSNTLFLSLCVVSIQTYFSLSLCLLFLFSLISSSLYKGFSVSDWRRFPKRSEFGAYNIFSLWYIEYIMRSLLRDWLSGCLLSTVGHNDGCYCRSQITRL